MFLYERATPTKRSQDRSKEKLYETLYIQEGKWEKLCANQGSVAKYSPCHKLW